MCVCVKDVNSILFLFMVSLSVYPEGSFLGSFISLDFHLGLLVSVVSLYTGLSINLLLIQVDWCGYVGAMNRNNT